MPEFQHHNIETLNLEYAEFRMLGHSVRSFQLRIVKSYVGISARRPNAVFKTGNQQAGAKPLQIISESLVEN